MNATFHNSHVVPSHPLRMRWALWLGVLGWTALVVLVLGWLVDSGGGPTVGFSRPRSGAARLWRKVHAIMGTALRLPTELSVDPIQPPTWLWWPGSFPLGRERLLRNLAVHLTACVAFLLACHWVGFRNPAHRTRFLLARALRPGIQRAGSVGGAGSFGNGEGRSNGCVRCLGTGILPATAPSLRAAVRSTILDLLAYGAVTGLVHWCTSTRRLRERGERRELLLESHLAWRASTPSRRNPTAFLFNSLNAITALLRRDPRLAETTLVSLSEPLRMALSQTGRQEGSLRGTGVRGTLPGDSANPLW